MCSCRSPRAASRLSCVTTSNVFFRSRAKLQKQIDDRVARLGIEITRWFIGKNNRPDHSSGPGRSRRVAVRRPKVPPANDASARPDQLSRKLSSADACLGSAPDHSRQHHILQRRQFREQKVTLENKTHLFVSESAPALASFLRKAAALQTPPSLIPAVPIRPAYRARSSCPLQSAAKKDRFALYHFHRDAAQYFDPARARFETSAANRARLIAALRFPSRESYPVNLRRAIGAKSTGLPKRRRKRLDGRLALPDLGSR